MALSTILQRTISGSPVNAIVLSNSSIVRPVTVPTGWTRFRIALRWHCTDYGANVITPALYIGMGSGTTNTVADYSTTNWIGTISTAANFARQTNTYSFNQAVCTKIGTTTTVGTSIGSPRIAKGAAAATNDFTLHFVDIVRGSPNYTVNYWGYGADVPSTDTASETEFLKQAVASLPTWANHGDGTARTIAFSEAVNALDTVQIFWQRTELQIEIAGLAYLFLE